MPRRGSSIAEQMERRRRERDPGGGAVVDMRIDVMHGSDLLLSVGGSWDRRLGEYDGEAETGVVSRVHAGQVPTTVWFRSWLAAHVERRVTPPSLEEAEIDTDPAHVYSALLAGGRRGGKTWWGALACAIYAVAFPGAIVWIVNPSDTKHDEVRRYMSNLLAPSWIARQTQAEGWELINGSVLALKSAYVGADPDAIKEGEAHLIWMNEGQKMAERVYVVGRGAIVDHSGLVLVCANPPVEARDQQWVTDFAADAQAKRRASIYHHFNPLDNPHINRPALLAMKAETDDRAFRIEVLGEFLGPADAVCYGWIRSENERPMPQADDPRWEDVTAEFLLLAELGDGIRNLPGLDFQRIPYIGGPIYRFFVERRKPLTRDTVVAWIIGEIALDGGDELDWCRAAKAAGYEPDVTMIVGDGTGEYQHSRRGSMDSEPPEWHGRGSFDIIRMGGFMNIVRPDPKVRKNNPHIVDRVRAFNSMICSGTGARRLFADPDRAPLTCAAIRDWRNVHGKPSRTQDAAHLCDGASYPIIRLFPRILRSGTTGSVDPVVQRVDVPQPADQLGPPPAQRGRKSRDRGW
jgi:hypothetical protein